MKKIELEALRESSRKEFSKLYLLKSKLEEKLNIQFKAFKVKGFLREYKFHPKRKWKFDFANPEIMIAIECEGGIYTGGRHVRGNGYEKDCQKYNEATLLGWKILRFTSNMINSGEAIDVCLKAAKDYLEIK